MKNEKYLFIFSVYSIVLTIFINTNTITFCNVIESAIPWSLKISNKLFYKILKIKL